MRLFSPEAPSLNQSNIKAFSNKGSSHKYVQENMPLGKAFP